MTSAQNSPAQTAERPESRKVTTLGRMTESIAKELNESLCCVMINTSTCLRMLAADPPNVEGARETARRTIRNSNRAAQAVSRLNALFYGKEAELARGDCALDSESPRLDAGFALNSSSPAPRKSQDSHSGRNGEKRVKFLGKGVSLSPLCNHTR